MAFKKYIYEIERARGESMTSWINRSDEALMDMMKKLATALGANSSTNNGPSTNSRLAASLQGETQRSGHCWSHHHDKRELEHQTCRKISSRLVNFLAADEIVSDNDDDFGH